MNNTFDINNLPAFKDMNSFYWKHLLLKGISDKKVRFMQGKKDAISLEFGGLMVVPIKAPIVQPFNGYTEGLNDLFDKYPQKIVLLEFIECYLRGEYEQELFRFIYDLIAGNTKWDCSGTMMVDMEGVHYHVDESFGIYKTVHDQVKGIRDGSDKPSSNEDENFVEYAEHCPHCDDESWGKIDIRVGLIDHCTECGKPILVCSMCDDCGEGCINCPEKHLKESFRA